MKKSTCIWFLSPIRLLFGAGFLLLTSALTAQRSCVISGKIIDKSTGDPLIGAIVQLDSTDIGAATDIEGNYRLTAESGHYMLTVRYYGYESAHIGVDLKPGDVTNVEYAMSEASALSLREVVVVGTVERSSDVVLNIELKKASFIASGISASEIRRSPDRTVGDILKRVTGASIQDGKFVVIRGMNDRYNAGYLDGALLSSTESDRKAFAFDVIPANLIDNLLIIKSGSPDLTGDFGGGVIKINTKSVPDRLSQQISLGVQYHSETTNKPFTDFKTYPGENLNFISGTRDIPQFDEGALKLSGSFPTAADKQRLAEIAKDFNHDWSSQSIKPGLNSRFAYSVGFPLSVGERGKMGVILALNYANTRRYVASNVNSYDGSGQVAGFTDGASLRNLNTGGLFNLNYRSDRTQLSLQNLVNVTSDFNTIARTGTGNYQDALTVRNTAQILSSNRLYNGILSLKQIVRDSLMTIDASLSYSSINRAVPDYRIASYTNTPDFPDYRLALGDFFNTSTGRFASSVIEDLVCAQVDFSKRFEAGELRTDVKAGYFRQYRHRFFSARSFVYNGAPDELTLDPAADLGPDQIGPNNLYLVEKTSDDLSYYEGKSTMDAFYLMATQTFDHKLKAVYGVRFEDFDLSVENQKTDQHVAALKQLTVLPSVNLTYFLNEKTNLRASYFSSVNRPEFRELAPFSFYVFDKNAEIRGKQDLQIATLNNLDIRYEFYPDGGQLISIGGFYKHIENPIELSLDVTQPFTTFTYHNEKSANILGLEFEVKKRLDLFGLKGIFSRLSTYANLSLIRSELKFTEGSQARDHRPLQGQSPFIINARLQYDQPETGWSANIAINRVGRRIAYVGVDPKYGDTRQDIYEAPRTVMDLQVSKSFNHLNVKITLGDLLHRDILFYQDGNQDGHYSAAAPVGGQGDRLMYKYKSGFTANLGLSYSF